MLSAEAVPEESHSKPRSKGTTMTTYAPFAENNPLDGVFTLEDQYYQEGYQLGLADGSHAGKLEGRATGLETGFEKFTQMGMLAGKATVWAGRTGTKDLKQSLEKELECESESARRLRKHIATLRALTDAETISTVNDEDACTAFDDRMKRATAKARVVGSIIGDEKALRGEAMGSISIDDADPKKDVTKTMTKRGTANSRDGANIEDIGMM